MQLGLPQVVKRSTNDARSRSLGRRTERRSVALRWRKASVEVRRSLYILANK